jgi:hypothetical protein
MVVGPDGTHKITGTVRRKRGVWVCHRGAGKDLTALAGIIIPHMLVNPGVYWHVFPKFAQGKKAIWSAQTQDGMPYLDRFPPHLVLRKNDTEMVVQLKSLVNDPVTGEPYPSTYQIVGGDTLSEHLVGAGPKGIVYSEWPIMDRSAYDYMAPRLAQTGGWVLFIFTPRGKNHGWEFYREAVNNPEEWFAEVLTIKDTKMDAPGEYGGPVITTAALEQMRRNMQEELIQQELFCSFDGFNVGTIFGDCLRTCEQEGRVRNLVRDVTSPVGVCFDIGKSDGTAALFWQREGKAIHIIDYHFTQGKGADWWVKYLKDQKPYLYGKIQLPHDADHERFAPGQTTRDYFESHFRCPVEIAEKFSVQQGIDLARRVFPMLVFDSQACRRPPDPGNDRIPDLISALGNYHRNWNEDTHDFSGEPVHDINSHPADALRTGAVCGFERMDWFTDEDMQPKPSQLYFNPITYATGRR